MLDSTAHPPATQSSLFEEFLKTRKTKWAMPVIFILRQGSHRFSEIQRAIGKISQKTLTDTLRFLEREGYVARKPYATIPPRVDYSLTELGTKAAEAFSQVEEFIRHNWREVLEARRRFDETHGD